MGKSLLLVDRSRSTTDWTCGRKRYLNYELNGTGIVPHDEPIQLAMGTAIHTGLSSIALETQAGRVPDIDGIACAAGREILDFLTTGSRTEKETIYAWEQATLTEGLLRGFYKYQWPLLLAAYPKILAVEQEMSYKYENILYMSKPDLVVATPEGEVVYVEYKSTSSKREEWINSWATAVQLHSTTRAIEASLGERISHVVVQGLYKGYESYGKQSSPFCYAYRRGGTPPFSQDEISHDYRPGFRKSPVWDLPGGIREWVNTMPEEVLAQNFPQTPPIFVDDALVENFFAQRNIREVEIDLARDLLDGAKDDQEVTTMILNTAFPQRFDQCTPGWGKGCPYKRLCFSKVEDPLSNGFVKRQPHHAIEEASR